MLAGGTTTMGGSPIHTPPRHQAWAWDGKASGSAAETAMAAGTTARQRTDPIEWIMAPIPPLRLAAPGVYFLSGSWRINSIVDRLAGSSSESIGHRPDRTGRRRVQPR